MMTGASLSMEGFEVRRIATDAGHIAAAVAGEGPAVLLLHGYPQTHVAWHRIAHCLTRTFTVIAADLRGTGESATPPTDATHRPYSKRVMAAEMAEMMTALGHATFAVVGHDRGARVAYRLALDAPERVERLAVIDILTTLDRWQVMASPLARPMQHWPFLAQPAPLPESLIQANPHAWVDGRLKHGARSRTLAAFDLAAVARYREAHAGADQIHAACEDFRAGATCDRDDDLADRSAGRRIVAPVLLVVASEGSLAGLADPAAFWRPWCTDLDVAHVESGHFVPEESPGPLLAVLLPFLARTASAASIPS
jgi:haloacetate dehalogenase